MRNKKILFMSIFILMIVLSIGVVSAEDADDAIASTDDDAVLEDSDSTISGTVSGGVDVVTENPNEYSGELSYDIPDDAKTIKSADVYVNIYGVTTDDRYGANVNTTIKTANGDTKYNESLCLVNDEEDHSIVHNVNDHVNKVYLNYMIHYNIKDLLSGLNGTKLTINVDSFKMDDKAFDGKIKLIALVLAYNDDSDNETISYWVNDNQLWTKSNVTLKFNTEGKSGFSTLTNIVLSSSDGSYMMNNEFLGDADEHVTGSTYQYNKWDVTKLIDETKNTTLNVAASGNGQWGSIRNSLSVLTINDIVADVSLTPEYTNTAYAGTNNTLTVKVNTNKAGKYLVKLLADNVVVDQIEMDLNVGSNTVFLTDPTIRPVDETTVNGATNNKVNYTAVLVLKNQTVNSSSINVPVLYNGNLGKDLAYPVGGMESFLNITVNGDIVIDVKGDSTYLTGESNLNRSDVWTINLDDDSDIVKSFVYVGYNWCDPAHVSEGVDMFNATFNGVKVTPVVCYRDQSNLGTYGKYGYGVLVYDVTDLTNKSGENTFFISKSYKYPAVYPSTLIYMYNKTGSKNIKEIYISNGADLLAGTSNNVAKRPVKTDSTIDAYSKFTSNATLYVFAAGAQSGEGNIVFNGETYTNVWSGTSKTTDLYTLDITDKIKDSNSISFVATGSTILALQQIIVLNKNSDDIAISLAPEYANTAYAGTNNAITITVDLVKSGKYTAKLLADGIVVNQTEIDLVTGTSNKFVLIDPTPRVVDETTVNGATNNKINYTIQLLLGEDIVANNTINLAVLYNGNLGKDLAYPVGGMESFLNITVNGDIVIDVKGDSTYLTGESNLNRSDVWTINLDDDSDVVKSFVYVAYNWCDPAHVSEGVDMFNATFNGVKVTPVVWYRDQSNLGTYGKYGYGVLVYDVTDLTNKSGENTFFISKSYKYPAVYPSTLIYMYNKTGSAVIKNVYISNGADLLAGTSNNVAKRPVKADSTIDVSSIEDNAILYVFAAGAQAGEGNIVFNGETYTNVWSGTSKTTDLYTLDITGKIRDSNSISFVATGSTILALQQIIVVTKKVDIPADEAFNVTDPVDTKAPTYSISLPEDATGNFTVTVDGKVYDTKELVGGSASITVNDLPAGDHNISVSYSGDDNYSPISKNTTVTIKEDVKPADNSSGSTTTNPTSAPASTPAKTKQATKIVAKKKTFKAKKKVKKYTITLKAGKKPVKKVQVTIKIGKKTYKAKTNSKGKAVFKIKKLTKKGTYKAKISFKGNANYQASNKTVKIIIK